MSERASNPPEEVYASTPNETDELSAYQNNLLRKFEKKTKRRKRLPVRLGATALALSSLSVAFWTDVEANRAEQASAEVSINIIGEPVDTANSHKATLLIDGFNAYDANKLTRDIGPAIQQVTDGELWSLGYNNALLSREAIYKAILETAEERGIESISIDGYSMGGVIAAEATADIVKYSTVEVDTLAMMSTPDGYDGLRPHQKKRTRVWPMARQLGTWCHRFIMGSICWRALLLQNSLYSRYL